MKGGTATLAGDRAGAEPVLNAQLRILAVGNMYPPHHAGGYELMWQAAVRHAAALGHHVRVLTTDYRSATHRGEDEPDVHRTLRWYWDLDRYEFPRLNLAERLAVERHNHAELRRHLRAFSPDLVTFWSMGCLSLSLIEHVRRLGLPSAFVVHDDWPVYGRQHDLWMRLWRGGRRLVAPVVDRLTRVPTSVRLDGPFVFNSAYTRDRAREAGVPVADAAVVHPGIEERFLRSLPSRPWGWRLAYVGRLDRQKGVDTAVRALSHLPEEATLTVWGTGDEGYAKEMAALASELGVRERVRFAGWVDGSALDAVYGAADTVVFPVRWNEPFGLVPLEAMGVGRPVVTTARGGTAEFVRDGENALVFEADAPAELAACVARLGADSALRARLREGGRATASRYTVSRFASDTVAALVRAARPGPS